MTILVTASYHERWCEFAQNRLRSMGVADPIASKRVALSPDQLNQKLCAVNRLSVVENAAIEQVDPGQAWQIIAADVVLTNADQNAWGWADPENLFFLDFWKNFDPTCRFVLVYGSLEQSLACKLENVESPDEAIEAHAASWLNYHDAMLSFYRDNQDRCILISIDRLENTASELTDLLKENFSLAASLLNESEYLETSSILELIAKNFVTAGHQQAELLMEELVNSADLVTDSFQSPHLLTSKAYDEFREKDSILAQSKLAQKNLEPASNDTFETENELLRAQLNQVQIELEAYFKKYLELKNQPAIELTTPATSPRKTANTAQAVPAHQAESGPSEIFLDLRTYIDGTGWHGPEENGRWAGANVTSTLRLPPIHEGHYILEITILDAISPDIPKNLEVKFDGRILKTSLLYLSNLSGALAPIRRARAALRNVDKPYPMTLKATIPSEIINPSAAGHALALTAKKTLSPSQFGQPDTRTLSVFVQGVKLSRVK